MNTLQLLAFWIFTGSWLVLVYSLINVYRKYLKLEEINERLHMRVTIAETRRAEFELENTIHRRHIEELQENEGRLKNKMIDYKNSMEKLLKDQEAHYRKQGK